IFTVDQNGVITAVGAGSATLTIKSKIVETLSKEQTITVHPEDYVFSLSEIVVSNNYVDKESIYHRYKVFVVGKNAFTKLEDALAAAPEDTTIYVLDGTYPDSATVTKNNVTIRGDGGVITGTINVKTGVSGLIINDLKFTNAGQVLIDIKGGVSDFTFKNNYVYDTTATVVNFKNDGTSANNNFVISDNVFEIVNLKSFSGRYIRGGNVSGLTIVNNSFEGMVGQYTDAIRIEGTNDTNAAGIGAAGAVLIENNSFKDVGQRAIWFRRYSATSIKILNNVFDFAGDQTYGGGIQLENWVSGQETAIEIKYNKLVNIEGSFGIRFNNTSLTGSETWQVNINYNKFIDFIYPAKYDCYIQAYSDAAKGLINADYNYFSVAPTAERMPFVGSYDHQFATEKELDLAIALLAADPTYGVLIHEEDMEQHGTIAYADTAAELAGLNWNIKEVYSANPGDASDKASAEAGNERFLRLRGANVAYMETSDYIDGLTTLVFDAKYYSSNHTTSVMTVSKQVEGGEWTLVGTITLTASYEQQVVAINETGKVKIRIDVTKKTANIDNLKLYQSVELFTQKFNQE
ncbi:MAG: hypothetical protein PHN29_07765, partial [Endomicrobiaceae bacterium]|nr:hypothetical protein [Endomicrobiaceae bacterium]